MRMKKLAEKEYDSASPTRNNESYKARDFMTMLEFKKQLRKDMIGRHCVVWAEFTQFEVRVTQQRALEMLEHCRSNFGWYTTGDDRLVLLPKCQGLFGCNGKITDKETLDRIYFRRSVPFYPRKRQ